LKVVPYTNRNHFQVFKYTKWVISFFGSRH